MKVLAQEFGFLFVSIEEVITKRANVRERETLREKRKDGGKINNKRDETVLRLNRVKKNIYSASSA